MNCIQCGKQIADDSKFCRHCGRMIDNNACVPEEKQDKMTESTKRKSNRSKTPRKNRFSESWKNKSKLFKASLIFSVFSLAQLVAIILLLVELQDLHGTIYQMDDKMDDKLYRLEVNVSSIKSDASSIKSDVSDIKMIKRFEHRFEIY